VKPEKGAKKMITGKRIKTVAVECPDCEEKINMTGEIVWGQKVVCPHCGVDLEVINVDPVELDWVFEDSDYDYPDDDEEDW
jgi:lysine biosynthesis protein LysW